VPELAQSWFELDRAGAMLLVGAVVVLVGACLVLWQIFGRGPRRGRRIHRAHRLLEQADWTQSLAIVQDLQTHGHLSSAWKKRLDAAESECYRAAVNEALAAKNFESAFKYSVQAARLTTGKELEARAAVIETMLAEVRRLFAGSSDNKPTYQLIERTIALSSPCPEALFWRGLCQLRDGDQERALASLEGARTGETGSNGAAAKPDRPGKIVPFIDPPLYLGALFLRKGEAKEALRYLTEANRIDGNCPFVVCQLGAAMIRAGGDAQLAVRPLQRALGPRGFQLWAQNPQRAWVEGFPDRRSYVRKLAAKHAYVCPLWGGDLQALLRQANTALGQGLYRLGQYQEASHVFSKLMQESAPSLPILRGLGLSLARLGQFDPAFKHLRIAHEMEETKDRITAGYLALCGAKGTPSRPEDKARNISWAIQLVSKFTAPGDAEWADLISALFAEARDCQMSVDADDQVYLCEHLVSVNASDALAAQAYHHLMATYPDAVHSEYAWLFCRASQVHGIGGAQAPALFARTFAEETRAREFFDQRQWDFTGLELTYLERAAAAEPGRFPAALGTDYPERGERLLLTRSMEQEKAGEADKALATAEVFLRLAPGSPRAHDRLAYLYYRKGERRQAADLLHGWARLEPHNPQPLVRHAIIAQEIGDTARALESIRHALGLTSGKMHADIAFLGARLMLRRNETSQANAEMGDSARAIALELLRECLAHDPQHAQALWCQAALRHLSGDERALVEQAPMMDQPRVNDPRFHLLAGVCQLAARNYSGVLEECRRTASLSDILVAPENGAALVEDGKPRPAEAKELSLAVESAYLAGWAARLQGDNAAAGDALQEPATANSPSAAHAQALLGKIHFEMGEYDEAIRWWKALDASERAGWKFTDTLAGATFLSALQAYQDGSYSLAAERLREAGRCGLRDRRLGLLLSLCLVKAGQQALYA